MEIEVKYIVNKVEFSNLEQAKNTKTISINLLKS